MVKCEHWVYHLPWYIIFLWIAPYIQPQRPTRKMLILNISHKRIGLKALIYTLIPNLKSLRWREYAET